MCRIVGFQDQTYAYNKLSVLHAMRDSMVKGGPDNGGEYLDDDICFGHRRLSILDLSAAGNQPFYYKEFVIIYNGEIYNFQEVTEELKNAGVSFESLTDTEVILKAFDIWGFEAVHRFRGMFAFAIWNKNSKQLILCRDRIGVKPLFLYKKDGLIMFSSELKAFHEHPNFDKELDPFAIKRFIDKGYIPSADCIYKHVEKVLPGHFYIIDQNTEKIKQKPYWQIDKIYNSIQVAKGTENEIEENLESKLKESFNLRMVADVPVGMFLSGGFDSTIVTAILQKQSNTPLKTFTIGFKDKLINEAQHAQEISNYLGTDHQELYCTEEDIVEHIYDLPIIFDEPLGTPSMIPTYMVSKLAKKSVKVSLSADGGDELFGGYSKYEAALKYFPKIKRLPSGLKKLLYSASRNLKADKLERRLSNFPVFNKYSNVGNKLLKLRQSMMAHDLDSFFYSSSSYVDRGVLDELIDTPYDSNFSNSEITPHEKLTLSYLGMLDIKTYLEGEIMCKVDRATMHNSLEGREPFLDHHLIEYAMSIPDNLKIKNGETKYLIKKILNKYVPKRLTDRPKQGFVVPIYSLLKNNLKDNILEMSNDTNFTNSLYLNKEQLRSSVDLFFAGKSSVNPYFIWHIFVLYQWFKYWIDN